MTFFENYEQFKRVFEAFWPRAITIDHVYERLCESEIIARFVVKEPELEMTIDFKNEGPDGKQGILSFDSNEEPEITVFSKSDIANKFWQGKLRTSVAMAKGDVKISGSVMKGLGLIGKIKPLHPIYIQVLKDLGLERMLV
ncbi:MAG: SCP2 sterol-binding domain-containing protein [Candidatus Thorarchaeota archaeon]|jgi:putative sterol carrier protein